MFALLVFRVHQCLDFALASFVLRWLELVVMIVATLIVVGTIIFGIKLL